MSQRSANCPNCGAPINFRWSDAVQTTCEYCHSILVRTDVDLTKVGEVAELPPNSSPIQIGTEGNYGNKAFTVIGRIIYDYEQGSWNEWHLMFQDGTSGWLSDAQLEYAVSFLTQPKKPLALEKTSPGTRFEINGTEYFSTVRTIATYRGVEGELPFEYWDKGESVFVDLRSHDGKFGTIDFTETPPLIFVGEPVKFEQLKLKNLREFEGWS